MSGLATIDLIDELRWRGLLKDCTGEDALREHLNTPGRKGYIGYDPTADSLTIGNLVTIMLLVHLARAGHEPVVVMGGGTGLIGDPSGKEAERQLRTREEILANVEAQRPIFERIFTHAGLPVPKIVNNLDWLDGLGYVEVLRDVGKHFSVNEMIKKESVRARLEEREHGISYTEFSYMVLQAYDYMHLFKAQGVTLQMGGSDQWGNIVAGADLCRSTQFSKALETQLERSGFKTLEEAIEHGDGSFGPQGHFRYLHAHALTCPLITKADGGKFGKTESGAVWITPERTSPYAFFQFWLNCSDDDVVKFLKIFTLKSEDEIALLERAHKTEPHKRAAHRELARAATTLVHGPEEAELAEKAGKALFSGDVAGLPERTLNDVFAEVPSSEHAKSDLQGDGADPVELLIATRLASSKREAREFIANGSVSVNGKKLGPDDRITSSHLLHNSMIAFRRGKKAWHVTRWA